ncbi:beta-1-4-N-acetylgalactosaminyltransferase bre-4-like [Brachionus plicatilis]|uniref:Beta-1-4-N-acetylgalactosaminyltransferase bre-4-like n=1 Tax=Brachionus plicatilis TaxID=10195 RepID=A0A3M7QDB9_BRAPC|nr:beta-1-4-N-acetylgalactosaminyltransferase bre-4-like [Brachionus plicatilis]
MNVKENPNDQIKSEEVKLSDEISDKMKIEPKKNLHDDKTIDENENLAFQIENGHENFMKEMKMRSRKLHSICAMWNSGNIKPALDHAVNLNDEKIMADILNEINSLNNLWNLDICTILLPSIRTLINSRHEEYMLIGSESCKLVFKNFGKLIKSNLMSVANVGVGVDISREESLELPSNFSQFKLCKTGHFKTWFRTQSHGSSKYPFYFLNLTTPNLSTMGHIGPPLCIQELFYYLKEPLQIFQSNNSSQINLKALNLFKNQNNKIQKFIQYKQNLTVIIIPFMNREQNLVDMLHNLHPYLQRQFLNYKIVVAEQINTQDPFNKGRLYNFAYDYLKKRYNDLSCLILQDVDLVPESDYNVYECGEHPRHLSGSIRSESDTEYGTNLYELLIGGVLCIRPESYEKINGFSNEFWYWGGEDDDMVIRMLAKDMCVMRPKPEYALYKMSKHQKSKRNPNRNNLLYSSVKRMNFDGLNNLNDLDAGVVEEVEFGMYVKLKINVGSFNRSKKSDRTSGKI